MKSAFRFCACDGFEDVDAFVVRAVFGRGGEYHAFGDAEFHLRGARLATSTVSLPTRSSGWYMLAMPENTLRFAFACVQGQLQQFGRPLLRLCIRDFGDAQIDF